MYEEWGEMGMLKNIPPVISPELLKILAEMGHGDELVIADGNFPSSALARRLVRADGHTIPALLDAILELFPLDAAAEHPVTMVNVSDPGAQPVLWERLRYIVERHEDERPFSFIDPEEFTDRAKRAYAIVATGEVETNANLLIRKGQIVP